MAILGRLAVGVTLAVVMLLPRASLGANNMAGELKAPLGFEVSPLGAPPPNPTTDIDRAMEWMKSNPERAKELDEFLEKNPDVFNMLLDSLDK